LDPVILGQYLLGQEWFGFQGVQEFGERFPNPRIDILVGLSPSLFLMSNEMEPIASLESIWVYLASAASRPLTPLYFV